MTKSMSPVCKRAAKCPRSTVISSHSHNTQQSLLQHAGQAAWPASHQQCSQVIWDVICYGSQKGIFSLSTQSRVSSVHHTQPTPAYPKISAVSVNSLKRHFVEAHLHLWSLYLETGCGCTLHMQSRSLQLSFPSTFKSDSRRDSIAMCAANPFKTPSDSHILKIATLQLIFCST